MKIFYQFLFQGFNKAEALRQSMIELKNKGYDPNRWAGFVCIGNINSISLGTTI